MDNLSYCNHLFDDTTEGFMQIKQITGENRTVKIFNTDNSHIRSVISKIDNKLDTYMTVNTHYVPNGSIKTIRQFRALYIDLDLKKYEKAETVYMVYDLFYQGVIPEPTMIIDSGRGIHLYWRIKNAPIQAIYTWQELEDYLYYKLKKLGADLKATDGARVLRLPSTINSKSNSECTIIKINENIQYSMYELRRDYLGYGKKNSKIYQMEFEQVKNLNTLSKSKVVNLYNSYTLHTSRAKDLQILCRLRNYNVKGYRNMIIHCYAYWLGVTERNSDILAKRVHELNNSFLEPLKDNEVNSVLRCIDKVIDKFIEYENLLKEGLYKTKKGNRDKGGYWYKNETLIEKLDITTEEQKHLSTIISKEESYRRNNARRRSLRRNEYGITSREQKKIEVIENVRKLYLKGYKQKEIVEELGLSKGRVSQIVKELKLKKGQAQDIT